MAQVVYLDWMQRGPALEEGVSTSRSKGEDGMQCDWSDAPECHSLGLKMKGGACFMQGEERYQEEGSMHEKAGGD